MDGGRVYSHKHRTSPLHRSFWGDPILRGRGSPCRVLRSNSDSLFCPAKMKRGARVAAAAPLSVPDWPAAQLTTQIDSAAAQAEAVGLAPLDMNWPRPHGGSCLSLRARSSRTAPCWHFQTSDGTLSPKITQSICVWNILPVRCQSYPGTNSALRRRLMWRLLAFGAVASITFGLIVVGLTIWRDWRRPLTDKDRARLDG